jgi:hypothetical protein
MPDINQDTDLQDLGRAILEFAVEDWYGLWELYHDVARSVGATPGMSFRAQLVRQLAAMIDRGLLEAAIWTQGPPRSLSAEDVRAVSDDSELWKSPGESTVDEQMRISATDAGRRLYFGDK